MILLRFALPVSLLLFSGFSKGPQSNNKVPVVDAGASQSISADIDSVTLSGSATDADGEVVAYLWSLVSGPSAVSIHTPGAKTTVASQFLNGTYVFQLTATDDQGATGADTVTITLDRPSIGSVELTGSTGFDELQMSTFDDKDYTGSGLPDMAVWAWTRQGGYYYGRHILMFDLSSIPADAAILSANLYLYSYPGTSPGNFGDANQGSNNTLLIQRITDSWTDGNISFDKPPVTTSANQVIAPATTQRMLDLTLNMKGMIQDMVSSRTNYGVYLRLQKEYAYAIRTFVNIHNTTYPDKVPRLAIVYKRPL